jgi:hypothetical protein
MYATKIVLPGTPPNFLESVASFQTTPRSQWLDGSMLGLVRELWAEQVSQGLVSELPSPNCFRRRNEADGTTTIYNATWVTREAAQQFVDLYAREHLGVISASVEEV